MIPVSVVTGYLGSGKTTIILNLIKQLPAEYKVVWLKNEYGTESIDSELAHESNIQVQEMLNGCLCCVLVGKLKIALEEILAKYHPDRIIIESSGTAYPLPIVMEIRRLPGLRLDGVINIIDVLNFDGYKDRGKVAEMQAAYTDVIVFNKVGSVDEQTLESVKDEVYELNPQTPKIHSVDGNVSAELLLGFDSKLVGDELPATHAHHSHPDSVQVFNFYSEQMFEPRAVEEFLVPLAQRDYIRIKGVVKCSDSKYRLLNWVFGKYTWEELHAYSGKTKIVFMGLGISGEQEKMLAKLEKLAIK